MKKKIRKLIEPIIRNRVYKIRSGIAFGLYRRGGFGFIPRRSNRVKEDKFIKALNLKNKVVFDIGANIGLFSLFFAKSVQPNGKIYSFEPNPIVYQEFLRNIEVNDFNNIQTFQLAVGSSEYDDQLIFDLTHMGNGSLNNKIKENLIANKTIDRVKIQVVSIDYIIKIKDLSSPEFIKIDVEGFEYDVLIGMKNLLKTNKPELFIEIHGATDKEKETNIFNIVKLLTEYKYKIKHIEKDEIITINNTIRAKEGHIYCC